MPVRLSECSRYFVFECLTVVPSTIAVATAAAAAVAALLLLLLLHNDNRALCVCFCLSPSIQLPGIMLHTGLPT